MPDSERFAGAKAALEAAYRTLLKAERYDRDGTHMLADHEALGACIILKSATLDIALRVRLRLDSNPLTPSSNVADRI